MVFLVGAAVEDRERLALLLALRQFLGADPRRAVFVLDDLGERLARHMHAAIDREARSFPGRNPADEDRHIAPAAFAQPRRSALGEAGASIADDNRRGTAREQGRGDQFEPGKRQARRHQQMPIVEAAFLARIDDRDLAAIVQPAPQFRRRDVARLCRHVVLPQIPEVPFARIRGRRQSRNRIA